MRAGPRMGGVYSYVCGCHRATTEVVGAAEYGEGYPVELARDPISGRLVVHATNEGGCNITSVPRFASSVSWSPAVDIYAARASNRARNDDDTSNTERA